MPRAPVLVLALALGLLFLYAPIALVVAYSFNEGRLATLWQGFSWRWYAALLDDEALLDAAGLSLRVAAAAATLATAIGAAAGVALARYGRFRGRLALAALLAAPVVLPEVVIGLALLLLFVALEAATGWPERGALTLVLAHATIGAAFVAVVVRARLAGMDPRLEEAAANLGATPLQALARVTLPLAAPALLAGWLLAFTLSLDDLVIASFVTGPGATTLPIAVFSSIRLGVSPKINALATLLVLVGAATVLASYWLLARRGNRARR